MAIVTMEDE